MGRADHGTRHAAVPHRRMPGAVTTFSSPARAFVHGRWLLSGWQHLAKGRNHRPSGRPNSAAPAGPPVGAVGSQGAGSSPRTRFDKLEDTGLLRPQRPNHHCPKYRPRGTIASSLPNEVSCLPAGQFGKPVSSPSVFRACVPITASLARTLPASDRRRGHQCASRASVSCRGKGNRQAMAISGSDPGGVLGAARGFPD